MTIIYEIDEKNHINYEVLENFIIIKLIYFDNHENLFNCMKNYFDYFASLKESEFLCSYPGTCNPLVFSAGLQVIKNYNFNYRIFYDQIEIKDLLKFEKNVLEKHVDLCLDSIKKSDSQSSCDGEIGKKAVQNGFKKCAIFSPLKNNVEYVKTPLKYYRVDSNNYLIEEYEEKPNENEFFYESMRMKQKFKEFSIRLENGKPKYYPKS